MTKRERNGHKGHHFHKNVKQHNATGSLVKKAAAADCLKKMNDAARLVCEEEAGNILEANETKAAPVNPA
jgi:hypothetical protein